MKVQLPTYLKRILMKMGILMLIFSLCRLVFYARNAAQFSQAGIAEFLIGIWFDLIAASLLLLIPISLELIPNRVRNENWHKKSLFWIYFIFFTIGITINLIDVEYFAYSSSRSTQSLFVMLGFGNDFFQQLPSYLIDYWWLIILWIALLLGSYWLLNRIDRIGKNQAPPSLGKQSIFFLLGIFMLLFIARGGFVHKPIRPTQAAKYTEASNVPLVLNSAFTVINSWGFHTLEEKDYYSHAEALELFDPIHQYDGNGRLKGQNICIIILESFAIEFINSLNVDNESHTPFFDQLVDSSLVFDWAFANGKKSIDAVPSIIASVPKFMSDEYLLSNYATNQIEGLPDLMGEMGYSSAFFHGATNGSMNFDAFCSLAGFEHYFGRSEYDNEAHYDGTWGIYDEEFLQWTVHQLKHLRQPFFSTIFTISSHPPYDLPERYENEFKDAPSDMHKTIRYTDLALSKFFESARKQDWFKNTLFILTADHTTSSNRAIYLHERGRVQVPLIMYHPTDTFFRGHSERIISHIDLLPTILDLTAYKRPFFSFGQSAFSKKRALTFVEIANEKTLFIENAGLNEGLSKIALNWMDEKVVSMYALNDLYQEKDLKELYPHLAQELSQKVKAIIQIYHYSLINNQMTAAGFKRSID